MAHAKTGRQIGLSLTAMMLGLTVSAIPFDVIYAQDAGLRGTQNTQNDNPYGDLQSISGALLSRPNERPVAGDYEPFTESDAANEAVLQNTLLGQPNNLDEATDISLDDDAALQTIAPRQNAANNTNGTTPETTGSIGPNGQTLPRGAVIAPDGTVLTGVQADRQRFARTLPEPAALAQQTRDIDREENPFEAIGIRAGSLILRPTLEQGLEYSSVNSTIVNSVTDPVTGITTTSPATQTRSNTTSSLTTLGLTAESDFSNGTLTFDGFLRWRETLSGADASEPEAEMTINTTTPIGNQWQFATEGRYAAARETALDVISTDPLANTTARNLTQSLEQGFGATGTISRIDGKLRPSFSLQADRTIYGDAEDQAGIAIDQSDRDQTQLRGTVRVGYTISPAVTPFVALSLAQTNRDTTIDRYGFNRQSQEIRGTVGADINLSEKLSGSLALGWAKQDNEDARLKDISGLVVTSALAWSPMRGTTVNGTFSTELASGSGATESGQINYVSTLGITREMTERLSMTATLGAQFRNIEAVVDRQDRVISAELAGTYWFSRYLGLTGRARHERLTSSLPDRDSDTTTLFLGMRLQR